MATLLHLDSSADLTGSRSRAVTATFADAWRAAGGTVVRRDLHRDPLPHFPDPALHWAPHLRPAGAQPPADAEALQQALVEEIVAADVVLVGAPMYNYSLPSTLKAWVDYLHVPGTLVGVDPLPLAGRTAVVVSSRGGTYDAGTPTEGWDHAVPVLQIVLGEAFGMHVEVLTASATLADVVPELAPQQQRAADELAAAHARAAELATRLAARPADRPAAAADA